MARGSLLEVDTQMAIALDLGYLKAQAFENLEQEVHQVLGLLNRLIESLREGPVSSARPKPEGQRSH
jgi:four helix bundle protein